MPPSKVTPNKLKRKAEEESKEQITAENVETQMPQFFKFYKGIELVPEGEWKHLMDSLFTSLPFSFRISERSRKINNVYEGRPGIVSESEVLRDFFKKSVLPQVANVTLEDKEFQLKPVPWYPKQMAWVANVNGRALMNAKELKPIKNFLLQEEKNLSVYKQDVASLIPAMLMDIQSHHKVLEMNAGHGYVTPQILEQMLVNPRKLPDGVLISNLDRHRDNSVVRQNQGTNIFYPFTAMETFPDIYTTEERDPASKLMYDRVFLKAHSSEDGYLMRNAYKARTGWTVNKNNENHKLAINTLKRGLELLAVKGQLLYYTNSLNPIENEAVVASVLEEAEGAVKMVNVKNKVKDFYFRPGVTTWKVMSPAFAFFDSYDESPTWFQKENPKSLWPPENIASFNIDQCLRVMPHDNNTAGMFMAVLTKTGPLPWEVKKEEEEKAEDNVKTETMDTAETEGATGDSKTDGKTEEAKCLYNLPIRCDVNVSVAMMEWVTEVVDEKLQSQEVTETTEYKLPNIKISRSCLPVHMRKPSDHVFKDVESSDQDWEYIRNLVDLKRFDPTQLLLNQHRKDDSIWFYCYCSPLLRKVIKCNPDLVKTTKFAGGLVLVKTVEGEQPDINEFGLLALLPLMNKRVLNVPKEDLLVILRNREAVFNKFTPRTKALLNAMDNGPVFFFYEPKGKNPDPRCIVIAKRERYALMVKNLTTSREHVDCHNLRLCGINPEVDEEGGEEDMDTE